MFDDVGDLDAAAVADRLLASTQAIVVAEAEQLVLAAHWADLHAPEFVADCEALLPGAERVKRVGSDGCPEMGEFAGAELAAYLGRSTASGEAMIADAVNLRHRHPLLWRALRHGQVRAWLAIKVARRCAAVGLSQEQATWVDAQVMPYVDTLSPGRFLALVEARVIEADPDAAAERAEAEELARFVHAGRTDEHGLRTLVARARAGDVTVLVAVLDRLAHVLAEHGDTDPLEVRRATALRLLADPARALALLAGSALEHLDAADDDDEADATAADAVGRDPAGGEAKGAQAESLARRRAEAQRGDRPEGWVGWMCDAHGRPLPPRMLLEDLTDATDLTDAFDTEDLFGFRGAARLVPLAPHLTLVDGRPSTGPPDQPPEPAAGPAETHLPEPPDPLPPDPEPDDDPRLARLGDRELLRALIDTLRDHPVRLDPLCVINVHTTRAALRDGAGVARVEELGPQSLESIRRWLGAQGPGLRIRVRPVVDPDQVAPIDRYEIPAAMRHGVEVLNPFEVFPFGTRAVAGCDQDHVEPYRWDSDGKPARPGQTRPDNLAPASRFHHRLKTHGSWHCWSPEPGVWWWRTPQGHWFVVDADGTHYVGRNADLDERRNWA